MARRHHHLFLGTTALLTLGIISAVAGPEGASVVGGTATVSGAGTSSVTVNQSSNRAIINWNTFNIGTGESARFIQPSSSSITLNRVTGGLGPSEINGTLTANGRVFLINRDGMLFGPNAVINTAGFLATTHDIKNSDFMAGRYNFNIPGRPDASIVNLGTITAERGGFAALVAPGVRNSGTITATLGTVSLAAGNMFTLDMYGDKLIQLGVNDQVASQVIDVATGKPLKSLVTNDGKLSANGGRVELTAVAARAIVDSVINTKGVIEANSVGTRNGMIVLGAATRSTKGSGAPQQVVKISGTVSAAGKNQGETGGTIVVTGEAIQVASATIDASGIDGGGKVMLGGDWGGGKPTTSLVSNGSATIEGYAIPTASTLSVDAATTINASARDSGNGGKVVLWSDQQTTFAGTILARGGEQSGDGGFTEVSSKGQLNYIGTADLRAPKGSAGTLLLDPADYYVLAAGATAPTGASSITNTALQNQLALGNVVIATNTTVDPAGQTGSIFVNAAVNWATTTTLTLNARDGIAINAGISAPLGGLTLNAVGAITATAGVNVGVFTLEKGAWAQVASTLPAFAAGDFRITGGSFLRALGGDGSTSTPYLITDVYGLQGAGSGNLPSKSFALANNIDAAGTANWNGGVGFTPIASNNIGYSGVFDGQGHTISNLTLKSNGNAALSYVGLFGYVDAAGTIRNLTLTNVSATVDPGSTGSRYVGTLAGQNNGLIENVTASGVIDQSGVTDQVRSGGLVGVNTGTIRNASANVAVTAGDESQVGGLVGMNFLGTIASSHATGAVTGGADSLVGGLVGANDTNATIVSSYATGKATGGAISYVGGLVGINRATAAISTSYAQGAAMGGAGSVVGGLIGRNIGTVDQTYATGAVAGGTGSIVGGLIALNTPAPGGPAQPVTNSYWDRQTTGQTTSNGGTSRTTAELTSTLPPGFDPVVWKTGPGQYPCLATCGPTVVPPPDDPVTPPPTVDTTSPPVAPPTNLGLTDPLLMKDMTRDLVIPASTGEVANTQPYLQQQQQQSRRPGDPQTTGSTNLGPPPGQLDVGAGRFFFVPIEGETRFISNEVVLQISNDVPIETLQDVATRLRLTILGSQDLGLLGATAYRMRINDGRSVGTVVRQLADYQIVVGAQANFTFVLGQQIQGADTRPADAGQYVPEKLHLSEAHRLAKGIGVGVAVIDSEIDSTHPDLQGVIADRYDTTGVEEVPHSHGTGMAGAMASHQRLIGVAPGIKIHAIRAFSTSATSPEGTTFHILKGLDWSSTHGIRIVNMSFAGPRDPSIERALKAASDKGVVLIAAAGNAGPRSPPLFPAADPHVIAVTATDIDDKLFSGAVRGRHIAVSAPGVDILVPAPNNGYQMTTGTSVATAHVSGIVALLLERNPKLTPADVRRILIMSAKRLGPANEFGAGLIDPVKALELAAPKSAAAPAPRLARQ